MGISWPGRAYSGFMAVVARDERDLVRVRLILEESMRRIQELWDEYASVASANLVGGHREFGHCRAISAG